MIKTRAMVAAFLSAAVVATLPVTAEAQTKPGMGGGGATVDLRVCNESGRNASVAVSYMEVGQTNMFTTRGWYTVNAGACRDLVTTDNANFYFYADATDGSGRRWSGSHTLCVMYPGPFTLRQNGGTCGSGQELRSFDTFRAQNPGTWTWTLDP